MLHRSHFCPDANIASTLEEHRLSVQYRINDLSTRYIGAIIQREAMYHII